MATLMLHRAAVPRGPGCLPAQRPSRPSTWARSPAKGIKFKCHHRDEEASYGLSGLQGSDKRLDSACTILQI